MSLKIIENTRIELGKTSGFERQYSRVTKLYFGGMTRYLFDLRRILRPGAVLAYVVGDQSSYLRIKIPDATPGIISNYCLSDEQALLAKLRYNRLVDIFTRVTCYSLQNHLRTTVPDIGQIETDEIYVGLDRNGNHFVFTVQAKSENDRLNIVQSKLA